MLNNSPIRSNATQHQSAASNHAAALIQLLALDFRPVLHGAAIAGGVPVLDDLVSVLGLALGDVRHDVEVCEEDEHEEHVAGQQVLTPRREVARRRHRVQRMRQRAAELDLKQSPYEQVR